jgi:hypothetical protein
VFTDPATRPAGSATQRGKLIDGDDGDGGGDGDGDGDGDDDDDDDDDDNDDDDDDNAGVDANDDDDDDSCLIPCVNPLDLSVCKPPLRPQFVCLDLCPNDLSAYCDNPRTGMTTCNILRITSISLDCVTYLRRAFTPIFL